MKGERSLKFRIRIVKDKHFYVKVLAIMLPVAAQQAINMGVNMMDTIMLGQLGEVQLSASSLANSFYNIFHIFCMGVIGGCSVVASHYYGAGENRKVMEVFRACDCICARDLVLSAHNHAVVHEGSRRH